MCAPRISGSSAMKQTPLGSIQASTQRFRPILMTSIAFIMGVVPLAISSGAGAESQNAIGISVMGGMLGATMLVIFFAPLFYVLIEQLFHKKES